MRILQVHNEYQIPGGEELVMRDEASLLELHGHTVSRYSRSNHEIPDDPGAVGRARLALQTVWSRRAYRELSARIADEGPDVVHVHNTFPLISPAALWAAEGAGVPVVQTLHNYRLACVNGLLMREGRPCEECVGRSPLPGVRHACYRDSTAASMVVAGMQVTHRTIGTYARKVHAFIALSEFAKSVMVRSGLPSERVHVKPNSVRAPEAHLPATRLPEERRKQVAFAGRITYEKGLDLLLDAWRQADTDGWSLVIIGDGPDRPSLQRRMEDAGASNVTWRGWVGRDEVMELLSESLFTAIPSRCYEGGFPGAAVESFATGTPMIAPDHAAFTETVTGSGAGLLFTPASVASLRSTLQTALAMGDADWRSMSSRAYEVAARRYGPDANYRALMRIYDVARDRVGTARASAPVS